LIEGVAKQKAKVTADDAENADQTLAGTGSHWQRWNDRDVKERLARVRACASRERRCGLYTLVVSNRVVCGQMIQNSAMQVPATHGLATIFKKMCGAWRVVTSGLAI
jgi:hypothetical protein